MSAQGSLVSRAESLLNRLGQVAVAEADAAARNTILATNKRVTDVAAGLASVRDAQQELTRRHISIFGLAGKNKTEVSKARTALRSAATGSVGATVAELAQKLHTASVDAAIGNAETMLKSATLELNRAVDAKRRELLPADIERSIPNYPGVDIGSRTTLEIVQRRLRTKIENQQPADLVAKVQQLQQDVLEWTKRIPALEEGMRVLNPEIQAFLRAVASEEGASWSLITPTVSEWLQDPDNQSGLRIRQAW